MILSPEESDAVEKLTIMTFVNEVMQFLQEDGTCSSQPVFVLTELQAASAEPNGYHLSSYIQA